VWILTHPLSNIDVTLCVLAAQRWKPASHGSSLPPDCPPAERPLPIVNNDDGITRADAVVVETNLSFTMALVCADSVFCGRNALSSVNAGLSCGPYADFGNFGAAETELRRRQPDGSDDDTVFSC